MKQLSGPHTLPLLSMIRWLVSPFAFMDACAQKYGDIFSTPLGPNFRSIVFVSNPQALQEIFTADQKQIDAPGELNAIFQPMMGKHGLFTLSGGRHRQRRKLLLPPFHGERMRFYDQAIRECTEQITSQWEIGKSFSVRAFMQPLSVQVISRTVFGIVEGPRYHQLQQLVSSMLDAMSSPLGVSFLYFPILQQDIGSLSPWTRFLRCQKQFDQLVYAEIQERREQPDPSRTDILTLLMSARDEAGEPMTDFELRDELLTLLFAGHEASTTALIWGLYWIHKLPSVREKLLQELDDFGNKLEKSAISHLPYLNAVCRETLRIYPPSMLTLPRVVVSPLSVMGYLLEPGVILLGCIYLTHQREDLYPEPKLFKPERFLKRQFSPYEYLPFGGGSRSCIGMAYAQFEMKVVLANILSRFELALADNDPVRAVRRGLNSGPSDVKLVAIARRP